jgi:hypothetical protein
MPIISFVVIFFLGSENSRVDERVCVDMESNGDSEAFETKQREGGLTNVNDEGENASL